MDQNSILQILEKEPFCNETRNFYSYNLQLFAEAYLSEAKNRKIIIEDMNKTEKENHDGKMTPSIE